MYIEDIILLSHGVNMNPWDATMIHSFQDQLLGGSGFTDKQSVLAVRILTRYLPKLNVLLRSDITQSITNPQFKFAIRVLNRNKSMSIVPHSIYGKAIKVEFTFSEDLLDKIRKAKATLNYAVWEKDVKAWYFSLDERSITFLSTLITQYEFTIDEELAEYIEQVKAIESDLENHVPMVIFDETFKFKNVSTRLPQPTSTELIKTLFEARQSGIHTWEENLDSLLTHDCTNPVVRDFLKSSPGEAFSLNTEEHPLHSLQEIVKYLLPCLIVIPGGSELEKISDSFEFLKSIGISNQEISVLFRLPATDKSEFNQFVKDNTLNNPVTENTKAVFISSKIPKTFLDPKKEFNCVMNFNFYSIHYTIRDFLQWHKNVIYILEKKQQRTFY